MSKLFVNIVADAGRFMNIAGSRSLLTGGVSSNISLNRTFKSSSEAAEQLKSHLEEKEKNKLEELKRIGSFKVVGFDRPNKMVKLVMETPDETLKVKVRVPRKIKKYTECFDPVLFEEVQFSSDKTPMNSITDMQFEIDRKKSENLVIDAYYKCKYEYDNDFCRIFAMGLVPKNEYNHTTLFDDSLERKGATCYHMLKYLNDIGLTREFKKNIFNWFGKLAAFDTQRNKDERIKEFFS